MSVVITRERPDSAAARELIEELEAHLRSLYPAESRHGYSVGQLLSERVAFFVIRCDDLPAGCAGIKLFGGEYGEVKRMYVRPVFRGRGLGKRLLEHLAAFARSEGAYVLRLETGIYQGEAIGLYERMGFVPIPPFGSYRDDPLSRFYEERLDGSPSADERDSGAESLPQAPLRQPEGQESGAPVRPASVPTGIRLAVPADAEQVQAIYAPYVAASISFEAEPPSVEEMGRRIAKLEGRYPWLVCEYGEEILGYAYASPHRERAAYLWSVDVSVYVEQGRRRQGIGRALYRSLFKVLSYQGYCSAYAGITLPNPASIGLHTSLGFQPVGVYRNVGYKSGAWHDVGWYWLELNSHTDPPPVIRTPPPSPLAPDLDIEVGAWGGAMAGES